MQRVASRCAALRSRGRAGALVPMQRRWNQQAAGSSGSFDDADSLRRRLLYRSKQRGWLEMDLMLGNWVRAGRPNSCAATSPARDRPSPDPRDPMPPRAFDRVQAADNLQKLGPDELELFQQVIDMENPDLYRWLTGQEPVPDEIDNHVLRTLCTDLRESMVRAALSRSRTDAPTSHRVPRPTCADAKGHRAEHRRLGGQGVGVMLGAADSIAANKCIVRDPPGAPWPGLRPSGGLCRPISEADTPASRDPRSSGLIPDRAGTGSRAAARELTSNRGP